MRNPRLPLLILVLMGFCHQAAAIETRPLRVAVMYKRSTENDGVLPKVTKEILSDTQSVHLVDLPYADATEFCELYRQQVANATNGIDLVLGPTESDTLKALFKISDSLRTVFLSPFVTTSPDDYKPRLTLICASPTDAERVNLAWNSFVKFTAPRAVSIVHTDDPWGHGIVRNLRATGEGIQINAQPLDEIRLDGTNGVPELVSNGTMYESFIKASRKHGASVIGVALLNPASVNEFFERLEYLNTETPIPYMPSVLLLNPPSFNPTNRGLGILNKYAEQFRLFSVVDSFDTGHDLVDDSILQHRDACHVIRAAAKLWPVSIQEEPGMCASVRQIKGFYKKTWPQEHQNEVMGNLKTGFHRQKLLLGNTDLDLIETKLVAGEPDPKLVKYFAGNGFFRRFGWRVYFFFTHNQSLINPISVVPFILVSFFSLLNVVRQEVLSAHFALKTWAFWLLFFLNASLTYLVWVLSIRFGIVEDGQFIAALCLAAVCPTAVGTLSDLTKRFLPIDLKGLFSIVEEINRSLRKSIGEAKLEYYEGFLKQLPLHQLQGRFFEVLIIEFESEVLRERILKRLQEQIKQLNEMPGGAANADQGRKAVFARQLVRALSYLCRSEDELNKRVTKILTTITPGGGIPEEVPA